MSQSRLSILQADPLFNDALQDMQQRMDSHFLTERASAMVILNSAAPTAAVLCKEMVELGTLDEEAITIPQRIDSIFDILNRTGNKAPDKRLVAHLDLAKLIVDAYEKKHKGNGGTEDDADVDDDDIVDGYVTEELEMLPVAI